MAKYKSFIVALGIFTALSFVACKSTPEPEPAPVEEPVVQPEEGAEEKTEETVPAENFSEANKALLSKVEQSRAAAAESGAEAANPVAFKATEAEYAAEKLASESATEDMSAVLNDLNNRYLALKSYADAKSKKAKIDANNFASYNQAAYDEGSAIIDELAKPESNLTFGSVWYKKATDAETKMESVLDAAYRSLSKAERTEAFKAKKDADSVKASVSRKAEYDKGVQSFKSGDAAYVTGSPEQALSDYTSSKTVFAALFQEISVARQKAQEAVDAAKKRVEQSETVAQDADTQAPLGDEPVEGIEEADTTLLEADDFTEAQNSVVELDETLEGEAE